MAAFLEESADRDLRDDCRDGWLHLMPLWKAFRGDELWAWTGRPVVEGAEPWERDYCCMLQVEAGTQGTASCAASCSGLLTS